MDLEKENSSKPQPHRWSSLRTNGKSVRVEKENIEKENKMPVVDTSRKVTASSPRSATANTSRYHNNCDRPVRPRGLQELDTTNNQGIVSRRLTESTSDAAASKPFFKTRFSIYDDGKGDADNQLVTKLPQRKSKERERSIKLSCLRGSLKKEPSLNVKKEERDEKSAAASTTYVVRTSPKNLPHIPIANVFKIKEEHKKASTARKAPKAVYEVLSLELAYNIDYMNEYVRFQMEISEKKRLSSVFLTKGVSVDQRRLIVKYLLRATSYLKYPSFILYQAVKIFDFYIDAVEVSVEELQIFALAALWITLKKDLIIDDVPEASVIMKLAGKVLEGNKKLLIECEKKILMALNFEISFAEPFSMLALYTVMIDEVRDLEGSKVEELYYCGSYLIDLSLLHDSMMDISAVHLAAVSAEIALVLVMAQDEMSDPQWSYWRNRIFVSNPTIDKYRLPDTEMNDIRNQLLVKVMLSNHRETDFYVVYKKYSSTRYGPVSRVIVAKISSLYFHKMKDPNFAQFPITF